MCYIAEKIKKFIANGLSFAMVTWIIIMSVFSFLIIQNPSLRTLSMQADKKKCIDMYCYDKWSCKNIGDDSKTSLFQWFKFQATNSSEH